MVLQHTTTATATGWCSYSHHGCQEPLVIRPPQDMGPQEPVWDDPIFEDVTIKSVIWPGGKHWDRGLYKLSNGRSAFASKGCR